ncbi:S8 family serine peptidase [Streptomyces sp. NPDC059008]|uniref:cyanobactin maturation protease PatG family protein n=1 Tax=Streptomyces sp. NPDC059008 TaxID=3346693 RepID=UPI00368B5184
MKARSVLAHLPVGEDALLGDARVCIAVLDGPVDLSHPCFADADLTRLDTLVEEPAGNGPMSLHGTHVTSLLFGGHGSVVSGLAPQCRGLLLPVFRDAQKGRVPQLDLARAIERAVQEGAHIINISGGERTPDAQADSLLERALRRCDDHGVLVVAAVGNDGCDCLQVPAAVSSVLAVGALGTDGEPLKINNWGAAYRTNGVLAPGQDIEGAAPGGSRAALTGSSFATPLVSGVAALLVGAQLRAGADADPRAAAEAILKTASRVPCSPDDAPECRRRLVGTLDAARAHDLITGRSDTTARSDTSVTSSDVTAVPSGATPHSAYRTQLLAPEPGVNAAGALPSPGTSPAEAPPTKAPSGGPPPSETTEGVNAMDTDHTDIAADEPAETTDEEETPQPPPEPPDQVSGTSAVATSGAESMEGDSAMESNGVDVPVRETTGATDDGGTLPLAPPEPAGVGSGQGGGVRAACGGGTRGSCECSGKSGSRQLVYAIGTIGFDFQTEARRDTFRQAMPPTQGKPGPNGEPTSVQPKVYDPVELSDYLALNPWESDKLTWTLELDRTPIYALEAETPAGMDWGGPIPPKPAEVKRAAQEAATDPDKLAQLLIDHSYPPVSTIYKTFRDAIVGQVQDEKAPNLITRVSIPGVLTDRTVRLFSGQYVPVVEVWSRGVATWNENALVNAVIAEVTEQLEADRKKVAISREDLEKTVRALLDKVYYQFRNLGQSSADRAMNYAGTNAFQAASAIAEGLLSAKFVPGKSTNFYALDTVTVSKSPYCRIGSDCQDVVVTFMDPEDDRRAKVNYLFTIDVSDIPPVSLAPSHRFLGDI